jgi:L,D-transpeptidase ErfK/SrfK
MLPDAPRRGIVINVGEMRLYYYQSAGKLPLTFPIGIGRLDFRIPLGTTKIVRKQENPSWMPTATARADNPALPAVMPPGPNNPMGRRALYLGWATYAIHGTNNPWSVGYRVSRGCIRLYPEGIETLYSLVNIGTSVNVVDQPLKLAWVEGDLYLEIHPSVRQFDELDHHGRLTAEEFPGIDELVARAAGDDVRLVDWVLVRQAVRERAGYPLLILRGRSAADNARDH